MTVNTETIVNTLKMEQLSNSAKIVYLLLNYSSNENKVAKINNKNISESTGLAEITISKALANLEVTGMITRGFELDTSVPGALIRTIEILK